MRGVLLAPGLDERLGVVFGLAIPMHLDSRHVTDEARRYCTDGEVHVAILSRRLAPGDRVER